MLMQPNQVPPAPPPYQPSPNGNNPYEFITAGGPVGKNTVLGGGGQKKRIIIVSIAAVLLLIVSLIVFSILSSGGGNVKADYQKLVQQQAELIRISEIGVSKARQTETKNLAITTQLTLSSDQAELLKIAKKAKAKTDAKSLVLGKDTKTDALLTTADQTNQFDQTFIKTLLAQLKDYQDNLKKVYDASSSKSTKDTLSKDYDAVKILLGGQSTSGTGASTPATN